MQETRLEGSAPRSSKLAQASLVLGILGLVPLGPLASIPAVVCGFLALRRIRRAGGALTGRNRAVAGLVVADLALLLWILVVPAAVLPALRGGASEAERSACADNLSTLGKGCVVYSMAHRGRFPPTLRALVEEGAADPSLYVCPATDTQPGDMAEVDVWSDYVIVPDRSGETAGDEVLMFTKPECFPGRGGYILTVDGTVRWHDVAQYRALIAGCAGY